MEPSPGLGLLAIVCLVGSTFVSGCAFGCDYDRSTQKEWVQPGLFDSFPQEGSYDGYDIQYHRWSADDPTPTKGVDNPPSSGPVVRIVVIFEDERRHVAVSPRDEVSWRLESRNDLTPAKTAAQFNDTFEQIGVIPRLTDWSFTWEPAC